MNTPLNPALPRSAAWLGFGGLLPFIGLALTAFVDRHHGIVWADALVAYGAVILSFVGALHWGFAMALPAMIDGDMIKHLMIIIINDIVVIFQRLALKIV